ncbi:MAG: T9SS type A sorting domain-containing protein [Bacteroidales bacterium]|nr:T9SS type A sorting domain-containing protein [Bacteroidales bacterium]
MISKRILLLLIIVSALGIRLGAQEAIIFFEVNMSYQAELGDFDPEEDFVDIAGTFNNWGEELIPLSDDNNDSIYNVTVEDFTVGQTIEFKFRLNGVWDGNEEFPGTGNNRVYTVESVNDSLYFWYNDQEPPSGPPIADFTSSSTSVYVGSTVHFQNQSQGIYTYLQWYFEGGNPETSSEEEPEVIYSQTGSYDVQLIAGNDSIADTLLIPDYIQVVERDTTQLDWWNKTVFYEIFVRSFYDSDGDGIGDFNGLTQKLDYLNDGDPETTGDLGIKGIWLMPVNPSPTYHGYDVTDYTAINPDYGTMEDFQNFLDAAHERGIKVIIDYVMNHSSSEHPWFINSQDPGSEYRDYYRWSETDPGHIGPWGQQVWHYHNSGYYYGLFWGGMPDLNYNTQQVKDSMFNYADYWLNDVGVDGYRLDAIKFIYEDGSNLVDLPETFQFWKDFNQHIKTGAPDSYTIGEAWTNTGGVINYVEDDKLDMCFEFDLAGSILDAANNGTTGNLRGKMEQVYDVYPYLQWGTFLTNHDMNRVFEVLGQDEEKNKLAASIYLTLPGVPFIYYGEEIGMLGTKPDPDIRRPMQWTPGENAGFTTGTPWHQINYNFEDYNVETESQDSASLLNRYKKMIRIRNLKPSLQEGDYMETSSSSNAVFSFIRRTAKDTAIVVINTSGEALQNVSIDLSSTGMANDSYSMWEMMNEQYETLEIDASGNLMIEEIEAYEVNVWSYELMSGLEENPLASQIPVSVYPNPAGEQINIKTRGRIDKVQIFNSMGQQVFQKHYSSPHIKLNVSEFESSVYIIRVQTPDGLFTHKILID